MCEEDVYFMELVGYIHLNPLRAKLVNSLRELDGYSWCAHSVVMGRKGREWQDRDYVLSWFGRWEGEARKAYRRYVKEGIEEGRRPELVGGGLIRSLGGWSQVVSLPRSKQRLLGDERILGSGEFVERITKEADERVKYQLSGHERRQKADSHIKMICQREGINLEELKSGSRRGEVSRIRSKLALYWLRTVGFPWQRQVVSWGFPHRPFPRLSVGERVIQYSQLRHVFTERVHKFYPKPRFWAKENGEVRLACQ